MKVLSRILCGFVLVGTFACGAVDDQELRLGNAKVTMPLEIADITLVEATVTAPDIAVPIVAELALVGDVATAVIANIPAGPARQFTVDAYAGVDQVCSGNTFADIFPGVRSTVSVTVQCAELIAVGEAEVTADFNFAPEILSVVAAPGTVQVGSDVQLTVNATDPDGDPITYLWSATDGVFADPTAPVTQWTAPGIAGNYPVTIEVTDSEGASAVVIIIINVTL